MISRYRIMGSCLLKLLTAVLLPVAVLTGCWDELDLTEQGYVSGLGIDYVDKRYIAYAQLIQFAAVAKTSSNEAGDPVAWVGRAEGKTVLGAISNLQKSSQFVLNLEHMKVLIVQERALPHLDDILDANNRQRASRYTSFVFGTREKIDKLFNSGTFFGHSHLMSVMYNPKRQYEQSSYVRPLTMQEFVRGMDEKGITALLPSIGLVDGKWSKAADPLEVQSYDGLFAFNNRKFRKFLPIELSSGYRWIDPEFKHYTLETEDAGSAEGHDPQDQGDATVSIDRSVPHITVNTGGARPQFKLNLHLQGHVIELGGPMTEEEIKDAVKDQIKREIEASYEYACREKIDLYLLGEQLYRNHLNYWRQLEHTGGWIPKEGELQVDISFDLVHTGKFDLT